MSGGGEGLGGQLKLSAGGTVCRDGAILSPVTWRLVEFNLRLSGHKSTFLTTKPQLSYKEFQMLNKFSILVSALERCGN